MTTRHRTTRIEHGVLSLTRADYFLFAERMAVLVNRVAQEGPAHYNLARLVEAAGLSREFGQKLVAEPGIQLKALDSAVEGWTTAPRAAGAHSPGHSSISGDLPARRLT